MTYLDSLQLFMERLNYKHSLKGESFREMEHSVLDEILIAEIVEWQESKPNTHHEIQELLDIMVACIIKIERITQKEVPSTKAGGGSQ